MDQARAEIINDNKITIIIIIIIIIIIAVW